ncbi:MAG: site-specific integrase [Nitrospirae bacterium]|nr:site-specific integrase [Nitrospirota bacterium]MBF0542706.1 site-specific integrase [Nitrospirota bacterium]
MLPAIRNKKELSIIFTNELPRYFHKHEINAILEIVKDDLKKYLLISLLWQTGARISEILNLRIKDIDFRANSIRFITLKRSNRPQRIIPIKGNILGLIGRYLAQYQLQSNDKLFKFTRQRAHKIVQDATLNANFDKERAHPHIFRHSFAVHCILNRVPILVVKNWLGHSNIQNTLIYMQVLGSDTRQFYDALEF